MARREQVGIDVTANAEQAVREINRAGGAIRGIGGSSVQAKQDVGGLGGGIRSLATGAIMGVGMQAFNAFAGMAGGLTGAVIGMNSTLEKSEIQFETLFKDADRAKEHVANLFEFAKKTPFETGPIIQASRTLQTFGGDALNTMANLTMMGDAAAGASVDINEVSFWVGRAYAAIQGGQPFGEARMRLQELALLSPQAAQKMEQLQKAGASTAEVWQVLQGELGRFTGAMEKQADTWEGLTSTLSDTLKLFLARVLKPVFDAMKAGLRGVIQLVTNLSDAPWDEILRVLVGLGTVVTIFVLPPMIAWAAATIAATWPILALVAAVGVLWTAVSGLFGMGPLEALIETLSFIGEKVMQLVGFIATVAQAVGDFLDPTGAALRKAAEEAEAESARLQAAEDAMASAAAFKAQERADQIGAVAEEIPEAFADAREDAVEEVRRTMVDVAAEIARGRKGVVDAMSGLISGTYDPLILAGKIAATQAELSSADLAKKLRSKDPEIRLAAEQRRLGLLKELAEYNVEAGQYGDDAAYSAFLKSQLFGQQMAAGLASTDDVRRSAAQAAVQIIIDELAKQPEKYRTWGERTGSAWVDGMIAKMQGRYSEFYNQVHRYGLLLHAESPPGPESPLHEIDKWGERTGGAWVQGLIDSLSTLRPIFRASLSDAGTPLQARSFDQPFVPPASIGPSITIIQNFGPSSVRSREDIRDIANETALRARLLGSTASSRAVGALT